jgi:hypothetical protein
MIDERKMCLSLLALILLISGCKRNFLPHSVGARDEVILIASSVFRVDSLVNALEKVEYNPTAEEIFNVSRVGLADFDRYKFWRNLIIVGDLGESHIKDLFGEEVKEELKKGPQLFLEKDLWVRLQTVIVIAGINSEETQQLLDRSGQTVYQILKEEEKGRFAKVVYLKGYQEKETKKMETFLGASFEIPLGYRLGKNEDMFMTYVRKNPDRLVTLLYRKEPIKDPIKFRDSLFLEYFNGDEVSMDSIPITSEDKKTEYIKLTSLDTVEFNNIRAIQLRGVWKNDKIQGGPMGGPFISYIFGKGGLWYFLDGHVFAPGKKKWPFLEEVDIILHTFKTEI